MIEQLERELKEVNKRRRINFLTKADVWSAYQQAKRDRVGWVKGGQVWGFNRQRPFWRPTNPAVAVVKLPRGRYGFLFATPLGWDTGHWFGPWTDSFQNVNRWLRELDDHLKLHKTIPAASLQRPWIVLSRAQVGCLELEARLVGFDKLQAIPY